MLRPRAPSLTAAFLYWVYSFVHSEQVHITEVPNCSKIPFTARINSIKFIYIAANPNKCHLKALQWYSPFHCNRNPIKSNYFGSKLLQFIQTEPIKKNDTQPQRSSHHTAHETGQWANPCWPSLPSLFLTNSRSLVSKKAKMEWGLLHTAWTAEWRWLQRLGWITPYRHDFRARSSHHSLPSRQDHRLQ